MKSSYLLRLSKKCYYGEQRISKIYLDQITCVVDKLNLKHLL